MGDYATDEDEKEQLELDGKEDQQDDDDQGVDLFIKTATDIKRVLPSIFNLKVVSAFISLHKD